MPDKAPLSEDAQLLQSKTSLLPRSAGSVVSLSSNSWNGGATSAADGHGQITKTKSYIIMPLILTPYRIWDDAPNTKFLNRHTTLTLKPIIVVLLYRYIRVRLTVKCRCERSAIRMILSTSGGHFSIGRKHSVVIVNEAGLFSRNATQHCPCPHISGDWANWLEWKASNSGLVCF